MANDKIVIKGAREHNLKNIDLTLPREKFIVMTGLSGSGKSSLAFDTIYADGQRRYVESLSSYARMFLGRMDKPDVDEITGLSPAISIDQKTTSHNPRSTVGTVTEIYDYLRLLYARVGVPHCPVCGRVISQQTVDEMVDAVLKLEDGTKFQVLAPVVRQRKGTQQKELDAARRGGYSRVRIDGNLYDLDEEITLEKNIKHTVEIVVDRLAMRKGIRGRLADSLETALALTGGIAEIDVIGGECMTFSQNFACPEHGISISDLSPRLFSFNNPLGACEKCIELLLTERKGHTLVIHSRDENVIEQFALKKPVARILVNTPAAYGGMGMTTNLFPAMTLGSGTIGQGITTDNVSPLNLVYVADRAVYEGRSIPAEQVRYLCGQDAAGCAENVNLYAAGHGLRSITRGSAPAGELLEALGLDPERYFLALAQTVGR